MRQAGASGSGAVCASQKLRNTARRRDGGRSALPASPVQAVNRLLPAPNSRCPPRSATRPLVPAASVPAPGALRDACLLAVIGLAGLAGGLLPGQAEAQVSRCVDRQGNSVFTDRPCEAVDSASRVPHAARASGRGSAYRGACARSLPMLIHDLSSAIQSGDANRLGMLYLWAGVSDADAVRTFNRLQSIVERPLVDIVPLRREVSYTPPSPTAPATPAEAAAPAAAPRAATRPDAMHWGDGAAGAGAAERASTSAPADTPPAAATEAGRETPRTGTRTVVTGLRLQQTAGKRATPIPVVLGLRRAYDCWWISLPSG